MNFTIEENTLSAKELIALAKSVGSALMEKIKDRYGHTTIFFGSRAGKESFYEKLGFKKSIQSYEGKFKESPYYTSTSR